MRVQFDATLDDFVDVTQRSLKRNKPINSWWNGELYALSFIAGLGVYVYSPGQKPALSLLAVGLVMYFYSYIQTFWANRYLRRICRERLGIVGPVKIEVELSERGVWSKQFHTEILRAWQGVTAVEEAADSIDFFTSDEQMLAVRKRAFSTEDEKKRFLSLAHSYLQASRSSTE